MRYEVSRQDKLRQPRRDSTTENAAGRRLAVGPGWGKGYATTPGWTGARERWAGFLEVGSQGAGNNKDMICHKCYSVDEHYNLRSVQALRWSCVYSGIHRKESSLYPKRQKCVCPSMDVFVPISGRLPVLEGRRGLCNADKAH